MLTVLNCSRSWFLNKNILIIKRQVLKYRKFSTAQYPCFAGHSKWDNIRHIKAAKDLQKSTLFTKYSRQIRLAIQDGGSADVSLNSQLKNVVDEAIRKNMPMATIQNNILKYKNCKSELKRYKLYLRCSQKVFAVCIVYTDNYTAVKMELATIFRKSGVTILSANNLFEEIGIVQAVIDKSRVKQGTKLEDVVTEDAITFGAEEVEILDGDNGVVNNAVEISKHELLEYEKLVTKLKAVSSVEEIFDNINTI